MRLLLLKGDHRLCTALNTRIQLRHFLQCMHNNANHCLDHGGKLREGSKNSEMWGEDKLGSSWQELYPRRPKGKDTETCRLLPDCSLHGPL